MSGRGTEGVFLWEENKQFSSSQENNQTKNNDGIMSHTKFSESKQTRNQNQKIWNREGLDVSNIQEIRIGFTEKMLDYSWWFKTLVYSQFKIKYICL